MCRAGVETPKQEGGTEATERLRVRALGDQLCTGQAACIRWIGQTGDVTADTLIKWGGTVGCGYLPKDTAKIQRLIDVVLKGIGSVRSDAVGRIPPSDQRIRHNTQHERSPDHVCGRGLFTPQGANGIWSRVTVRRHPAHRGPKVNCPLPPNQAYYGKGSNGPPRGKPTVHRQGSTDDTDKCGVDSPCWVDRLWGRLKVFQRQCRWIQSTGGVVCHRPDPEGLSGGSAQGGVAGAVRLCTGGGRSDAFKCRSTARGRIFQEPAWIADCAAIGQCQQ